MNSEISRFKTNPFDHQLEYLRRFGRSEYCALACEMGTGKSWMIINDIADLWGSGDLHSVLILAPNGVHINWYKNEVPKHMPDWVRYKMAYYKADMNKSEQEIFKRLFDVNENRELRLLFANHEALQYKKGIDTITKFCNSSGKLMIVVDESDAFSNPNTIRTEALMNLKKYSSYRRIMSGTMVNNSPFDLYSQYMFLDGFIFGTTSFYAFKNTFGEFHSSTGRFAQSIKDKIGSKRAPMIIAKDKTGKPKYKNLDKLSKLIEPHTFRKLKSQCLDLPEKLYKGEPFTMTKEQSAAYKKAVQELRLEYGGSEVPISALTKITKLSQITSGYYIMPDTNEIVIIEGKNPKLELCMKVLNNFAERNEKTIIWCRYKQEVKMIKEEMRKAGINYVEYTGDVSNSERQESIENFQNGDALVFIATQKSGGTGLTLTAAQYVIYYSNTYSLRDRLQSEDRAHRIGQTKNVLYIDIFALETIDESVISCIKNKKDFADEIMNKGLGIIL